MALIRKICETALQMQMKMSFAALRIYQNQDGRPQEATICTANAFNVYSL